MEAQHADIGFWFVPGTTFAFDCVRLRFVPSVDTRSENLREFLDCPGQFFQLADAYERPDKPIDVRSLLQCRSNWPDD